MSDLPIVVIGAGPRGLAAAAHLLERSLEPRPGRVRRHIHTEVAEALQKLGLDTSQERPRSSPTKPSLRATWRSPSAAARSAPTSPE